MKLSLIPFELRFGERFQLASDALELPLPGGRHLTLMSAFFIARPDTFQFWREEDCSITKVGPVAAIYRPAQQQHVTA